MESVSVSENIQACTMELFQGEVLGEVFFDGLLSYFRGPVEQYKIATLLQLETETKARLRPFMISIGMDLSEDEVWRQRAIDLLATFEGKSWRFFVESLNEILQGFVTRYKEIASTVPDDLSEIHHSMVIHETALLTFTELELSGDVERSLDDVIALLKFPLPKPV